MSESPRPTPELRMQCCSKQWWVRGFRGSALAQIPPLPASGSLVRGGTCSLAGPPRSRRVRTRPRGLLQHQQVKPSIKPVTSQAHCSVAQHAAHTSQQGGVAFHRSAHCGLMKHLSGRPPSPKVKPGCAKSFSGTMLPCRVIKGHAEKHPAPFSSL